MEKEELKEAFIKLCDYWFGEYGYSIQYSKSITDGMFIDAVGLCAHDGNEFDVAEKGFPHRFFLNEDGGVFAITATALETNACNDSDVMEFLRYGLEMFFFTKKDYQVKDNEIVYKIISIRNTNN